MIIYSISTIFDKLLLGEKTRHLIEKARELFPDGMNHEENQVSHDKY